MDFNLAYNQEDYIKFFRDSLLPEDYEVQTEQVEIDFKSKYFKTVTYMGKCSSLDLNVYEVKHNSANDARVGLSRDAFKLISRQFENNALILFVPENADNYRLSLVTIDPKLDDAGIKILKEYSNPRRYSFSLGEGTKTHTPEQFLIGLGRIASIEDLKRRFSVEVVNKEFYNQIAQMFSKLVGGKRKRSNKTIEFEPMLVLPSYSIKENEQLYKEFAVRLIGRTVFCWFLKKKKSENGIPLIPENILSGFAVNMMPDYYHTRVEPLFFKVLNTSIDKRETEYAQDPYNTIPFLNGGLFEPQTHDFYSKGEPNYALKVPDEWWREFIDILETYNFTIDENTSIDVDLSVDPEMLGRIFENLLAELNPETGETARKSTGSYYTPRPIVEYMVDESLKQHIHTKTGIELDKLSTLLSYSEEESGVTKDEEKQVKEALDNIKVLDPACGSGAFPMGILQKMLLILQKVDSDASYSIENILKDIPDPTYRALIAEKLKDETALDDYAHKLSIIRRSIYGIDIQPIAIEISKLRFFLSLIVDEKVEDNKKNRAIEPLPNLEFKFACANTLIPLPENKDLFDGANADDIENLEKLRDEYFISYGDKKKQLQADFTDTQKRMFTQTVNLFNRNAENTEHFKSSQSSLLATWNPFSHEHTPWFDAKWMFGVSKGFDVVIGNPPYIQLQKEGGKLTKMYEPVKYKTFAKTGDIYCLFYEHSINVLADKGISCLITSDKWMLANYGKSLRNFLISNSQPLQLIGLGANIFDTATVNTNILIAKKSKYQEFLICDLSKKKITTLAKNILENGVTSGYEKDEPWVLLSANELKIKKKIENVGTPLKDWQIKMNYGIKTGLNDVFIINKSERDILLKEDSRNEDVIKPVLSGKDLKRYKINFKEEYLLFIPWHFPLHETLIKGASEEAEIQFSKQYPSLYNYISKHKDKLSQRNKSETGIRYEWYALQRCANTYFDELFKEKIVWGNLAQSAQFGIANDLTVINAPGNLITPANKYLLAVLNSKLGDHYIRTFGVERSGGYFEYKPMFVEQLPVPQISEEEQKPFEVLVDYIQYLKAYENPVNEYVPNEHVAEVFEEVIDGMVFELYFKDEFKKASLGFHEFAVRDFKSIEGKDEKETREIIHSSYQMLREKENEIRNNLKLMDTRLEDIVMLIKSGK